MGMLFVVGNFTEGKIVTFSFTMSTPKPHKIWTNSKCCFSVLQKTHLCESPISSLYLYQHIYGHMCPACRWFPVWCEHVLVVQTRKSVSLCVCAQWGIRFSVEEEVVHKLHCLFMLSPSALALCLKLVDFEYHPENGWVLKTERLWP